MKKKIRLVSLLLAIVFILSACGGNTQTPSASNNTPSNSNTEPAPSAEPGTKTPSPETPSIDPVEITCGSMGNPNTSYTGQGGNFFMEYLAEVSGGAMTIDMHDQSSLGMDSELIQQCIDGTVPFVIISTSIFSTYTDLLDCLMLPFMIDSYELEYELFRSDEFKALADAVAEEVGVKIIANGENGLRHFVSTVGPINSVSDMSGLKIRVAQNELLVRAMEMLGANPIPLAYSELYTGLQNNVINAEEINFMSVNSQKHYEVANYMSLIGLYPYSSAYVVNLDFWNSLTPAQQECMLKAGEMVTEKCFTDLIHQEDESAEKNIVEAGMTINQVENVQEFYDAMSPLYDEYAAKDPLVAAFIEKALSLKS